VLGVAALGAVLFWALRHVDFRALGQALVRTDARLLALAAVINIVALAVQAWRWYLLLQTLGPVSYPTSLAAMIFSFAISSLAPARAGELARVRIVARDAGLATASVVGGTVLDHVINGVSLAPLALLIPLAPNLPPWLRQGVLLVLAVALAAGAVAWLVAPSERKRQSERGMHAVIADLRQGFTPMRAPGTLIRVVLVAMLAWAFEVATTVVTLAATGLPFDLGTAVVTLIAVNLALVVPAPPANLGTFEVGAVLALTALGVPRAPAVAFALCYHALQLVSVWLAGAVTWAVYRGGGPRPAHQATAS
jgi:uncharacterized protein (TIRG00374 family)